MANKRNAVEESSVLFTSSYEKSEQGKTVLNSEW